MDGARTGIRNEKQSENERLDQSIRMAALLGVPALVFGAAPISARDIAKPSRRNPARPQPLTGGTRRRRRSGHRANIPATAWRPSSTNSLISNYDLRQRMALFIATSGVQPTPEVAEGNPRAGSQAARDRAPRTARSAEKQRHRICVRSRQGDRRHHERQPSDAGPAKQDAGRVGRRHGNAARTDRRADRVVEAGAGSDWRPRPCLARRRRCRTRAHQSRARTNRSFVLSEIFQAVDTPEQDAKVQKDMRRSRRADRAGRALRRRRAAVQPEPDGGAGRRYGHGSRKDNCRPNSMPR